MRAACPSASSGASPGSREARLLGQDAQGPCGGGALKYVSIGHGSKRPRHMFTDADLDAFIAAQTRKVRRVHPSRRALALLDVRFQVRGHRFYGSTKCTTRREAEAVEAAEREKARRRSNRRAASTSLRLDDVAGRYWQEVGRHHAGRRSTERQIGYLIEFFGKEKLLTDITGDDVAGWSHGGADIATGTEVRGALISAFTVNDTIEATKQAVYPRQAVGRALRARAAWRKHWLAEPQERVRELVDDEAADLKPRSATTCAVLRLRHAAACGCSECLLRWSEIDWARERISKLGKGGRLVTTQITALSARYCGRCEGIILNGVHLCCGATRRTGEGPTLSLTYSGVKIAIGGGYASAPGSVGFRFHDSGTISGPSVARDRQPEDGAGDAQPCRSQDHEPLCACARRRGGRSDGARRKVQN